MLYERLNFPQNIQNIIVNNFIQTNTELSISTKQIIKMQPSPTKLQINFDFIKQQVLFGSDYFLFSCDIDSSINIS